MISSDNLGQLVRYYSTSGWHVGTLAEFHRTKGKFVAVIKTPIAGQRKKRVPAEDVEVYTDARK